MISDLILDIRPTTSCKSFLIKDISVYNENLPVTCGTLSIMTPGYCKPSFYDVAKDFEKKINMSNLELQKASGFDCLSELPDGIFKIKYSINPNDKLFVEYNYMNTCKINKRYMSAICDFLSNRCDLTKSEQKEKIEGLFEISSLIEYSKAAAEDCGDDDIAMELYEEANEKLKNLNSGGLKTCS